MPYVDIGFAVQRFKIVLIIFIVKGIFKNALRHYQIRRAVFHDRFYSIQIVIVSVISVILTAYLSIFKVFMILMAIMSCFHNK